MTATKILVVEDEMIIAADISMMLTSLGYDVTGIVPRGEDALKNIESTRPDLVLMDISLRGSLDGVETAKLVRDQFEVPVIFLTSNTDDATFIRAKETKPYAFISKPFRQSDLQRAIELALDRIEDEKGKTGSHNIVAEPNSIEDDSVILSDRIFVRHKDRMVKIYLQDILFAEADRNYCKIYTMESEYLMTLPLGSFEEKLQSKDFLRIHRSHIINVNKVDAISDQFQYVTIGKKVLAVSRSHQEVLAQRVKVF